MRRSMQPFAAAMLSAALLLAGQPAWAQNRSEVPSVSDQELDAAAAALERVVPLQQNYKQQLAATPEPKDQERVASEANQALTKAVTDQGLTVEQYSTILEAAQRDPAVRQKLLERVHIPAK